MPLQLHLDTHVRICGQSADRFSCSTRGREFAPWRCEIISDGSGLRKHISRRDALKVLGVGAAGTLIPADLAGQSDQSRETDVVVVGAGFAGLIAARNLLRAGNRVVLLEARDRVGGRVKSGQLAGHPVDVGGMWVGPTQTRLVSLIN